MKPRPAHVQRFIDLALPVAREIRRLWGVPVSVFLAQGALESGWNFFNPSAFGTAKGGNPAKGFVRYPSFIDAASAYAENLRTNRAYARAWVHFNTPDSFIDAIALPYGGSTTSYAPTVKKIIRDFDLDMYDAPLGALPEPSYSTPNPAQMSAP